MHVVPVCGSIGGVEDWRGGLHVLHPGAGQRSTCQDPPGAGEVRSTREDGSQEGHQRGEMVSCLKKMIMLSDTRLLAFWLSINLFLGHRSQRLQ